MKYKSYSSAGKQGAAKITFVVFMILGLLFMIGGVIACVFVLDYDNTEMTMAEITKLEPYETSDGTSYRTHISFTVNGVKYNTTLNSYSSSFREGNQIEIYYHKDNPNRAGIKSMDLMVLMFPGFGLIFFSIGAIALLADRTGRKKAENLRESGRRILATYIETIMNKSYSVNGMHPYRIYCSWTSPDDGKEYIFKSKNLWDDPREIIAQYRITDFPVYIAPDNPKCYTVDVDSVEIEDPYSVSEV